MLLLLAATLALALVPTLWPSLDFAVSAYFLDPANPLKTRDWWWVEAINEHVPTVFRAIAVLFIPAWWWARRRPNARRWASAIAFVGLSLWVGPGLLVSGSKELTLRARPQQVQEFGGSWQYSRALTRGGQCNDSNCAFPSGHTADGIFLASLMLLFPRRRFLWAGLGLAAGALVAFARVSVGAHWLSDVLWAFPITLLGSLLTYGLMWRAFPTQGDNSGHQKINSS
ncbi:MAG: hypothetical protein RLZZ126_1136 [Pseudomonadota bacterium]|jgi:lipid A 4'-phosphatase